MTLSIFRRSGTAETAPEDGDERTALLIELRRMRAEAATDVAALEKTAEDQAAVALAALRGYQEAESALVLARLAPQERQRRLELDSRQITSRLGELAPPASLVEFLAEMNTYEGQLCGGKHSRSAAAHVEGQHSETVIVNGRSVSATLRALRDARTKAITLVNDPNVEDFDQALASLRSSIPPVLERDAAA